MDPDDLHLAFQPHATSKLIEAGDLFRIRTLGFRGEALAAIAEVSRTRCQTRKAEALHGSEIAIDAGVCSAVRECATSPGTIIEVRNLFHNTPRAQDLFEGRLHRGGARRRDVHPDRPRASDGPSDLQVER